MNHVSKNIITLNKNLNPHENSSEHSREILQNSRSQLIMEARTSEYPTENLNPIITYQSTQKKP